MSSPIALRLLEASDGPGVAGLSYSSPDEGLIRYAVNYQVDALRALQTIHGDMVGVAAHLSPRQRLAGVGVVRFGRCQMGGQVRPFALIGNLIVHPDFRGQGLAAQIVERQTELAKERTGDDGVILANVQYGNQASLQLFKRWLPRTAGRITYLALPTRTTPPPALAGYTMRPVRAEELETYAQQLNAFYRNFTFFVPESGDSLAAFLARSPLEAPVRRPYAVFDAAGKMQAGLVAMEEFQMKHMEIRGVPPALRLINQMTHILPADRIIRGVYLDHVWHAPGEAAAARMLAETMRRAWYGRATNLAVFIDPHGPLRAIFPVRPWIPAARTAVLYQAAEGVEVAGPIYPIY